MKRIRKVSILTAALLTLMAAFAVASASAGTALCDEAASYCNPEDVKPSGTQFVTETTGDYSGFYLESSAGFECSFNRMTVETTRQVGRPLTANFTGTLDPSKCRFAFEFPSCSSASLNSPPTSIEHTQGGAGVIKIGSKSSPLRLSVKCTHEYSVLGSIKCEWAATDTVEMSFDGDETATISAAPMTKVSGSGFCSNGTLNVSNEKDASSPYISEELETVFCKAVEFRCSNANVMPFGSLLYTAGAGIAGITVTKPDESPILSCDGDRIAFVSTGPFPQYPAVPMYMAADTDTSVNASRCSAWGGPSGECSSVEMSEPPSVIRHLWANTGVAYIGNQSEPFTLSMTCGKEPVSCEYTMAGTGSSLVMDVDTTGLTAATPAALPLTRVSGPQGSCGAEPWLTIENSVDAVTTGSTYISFI